MGPLLFLLYVNDIQHCVNREKLKLFADDTGIFQFNQCLNQLITEASTNLSSIYSWFEANLLALSLEKSHFIIFHSSRKKIDMEITALNFGNKSIPRAYETKYIGITIDENLSWKKHVENVLKSLYKYFSLFYKMRQFVNNDLVRTIFYSCVYSRIQYGLEVYGTCNKTLLGKLQIIQNKLLRILGSKDRYYSTRQLHNDYDLLNIVEIRNMMILKFVYKCVKGQTIQVFENYFTSQQQIHNTRQTGHLRRDAIHTEIGRATTHYTGASLWNKLPNDFEISPNFNCFKPDIRNLIRENPNIFINLFGP